MVAATGISGITVETMTAAISHTVVIIPLSISVTIHSLYMWRTQNVYNASD
jgi:hypothetical protein